MANLGERVDQLFAEWDRPDSPGCAIGAIRDGELVYKNGYGAGDLEAGTLNNGEELDYSAGLIVGDYKGLRLVHHSGGMLGFRTIMARFPAQKFTVVLLGNLSTIDTWKLMTQVADIYLADHYKLHEFAGEYYSEELAFTYQIATAGSDLFLRYENAPSEPLASLGRDKFRVGNRNMHFERDACGQLQGFSVSTDRAQNLHFARA